MTTSTPARGDLHTAGVDELTVGQVARLHGVTVRTLHHYDEIGLLSPSARTPAGYRLYQGEDLERLARIVTYRRLGFPLQQVASLMAEEGDVRTHLQRQREAVMSRLDELTDLVAAIDDAMERAMTKTPATTEDLKRIFGEGFSEEYQQEAQERWGETERWAQSRERAQGRTAAEWEAIKAEQDELMAAFAAALTAGEAADSTAAMDLAERHRVAIDRDHYECPPDFHVCLGQMYVEDPRFRATFEERLAGLAHYVSDAISANAARAEAADTHG